MRVQQIRHAVQMWLQGLGRAVHESSGGSGGQTVVFAVTDRYPTRILLYEAAFQGGWKIEFMKSLRDVLESTRSRKPKAVFYDHDTGLAGWDQYCSALAAQRVPFILLGHKSCDDAFMVLLERGGYHAWGNPLRSEDVVKAVAFAEEVTSLSHAPVGSALR